MKYATFAVDIDGTITENGGGRIHLDALSALRHMARMGHKVIFVSGRSSIEGYMLAVFGGTTQIAVGENGGCITTAPSRHVLIGSRARCLRAFHSIQSEFDGVREKPVFPRLTEVVLERTFDIESARRFALERSLGVDLSDSRYAFHINSSGINKGMGFQKVMGMLDISREDVIAIGDSETDIPLFEIANTSIALGNSPDHVMSRASMVTSSKSGDGVIEAMDKLAPRLARV